MIRIACDVHTHTIFSRHAYSTLGAGLAGQTFGYFAAGSRTRVSS